MHIETLSLKNWLRYRGTHTIDLSPSSYALRAKWDVDEARSNWAGKSSILEAVAFALYGVHRKRLDDEWITNGEDGGSVELVVVHGTQRMRVLRERQRGKPTRLVVEVVHKTDGRPGEDEAGRVLLDDEAQRCVEKWTGVARKDFDSVSWFAQKSLSRLVTLSDSARTELLSRWFGLDPLRLAAKKAKEAYDSMTKAKKQAQERLAALGESRDLGAIETAIASFAARSDVLRRRLGDVASRRNRIAARHGFEREREDGLALKKELEVLGGIDQGAIDKAKAALEQANRERWAWEERYKEALRVARIGFDGECPVVRGFACPVADHVGAKAKAQGDAMVAVCTSERPAINETYRLASMEMEALRQVQSRVVTVSALLEQTRVRAQRHLELMGEDDDKDDDAELLQELASLTMEQSRAEHELRQAQTLNRAIEERMTELVALGREERAARLAWVGIRTALRERASLAVRGIEARANHLLAQVGIDVRIAWTWGRSTKELQAYCDECGAAFGSSAKVKACPECGAERGFQIQEIDEIVLSDRSGAAEDLAGMFLQFAVAEWLRAENGALWGVALIDEPFGALDEANRRALAGHLVWILRETGFVQAIVVGHHPEIGEQFPEQIVVYARPSGSEVVAS